MSGVPSLKDESYKKWKDEKTTVISNTKTDNIHSVDGTGYFFLFGNSDSSYNKQNVEYLVHLTSDSFTIPTEVTHLSFYISSPYFSSKAKNGLNILIDDTVIMRFDVSNIFNFGSEYELVDVNIKKYADGKGHDLKFHYTSSYLSEPKLFPTLLVDFIHFMSCSNENYVNSERTQPVSTYAQRCSQWCTPGYNFNDECNEECNVVECGYDLGMCDYGAKTEIYTKSDPDDKKIENVNSDNSKTKRTIGLVLVILAAVILVAFLVVFSILVYRTRETIIVKKGSNSDGSMIDETYVKLGADGNSELWTVDKKMLTFDLGGREADIDTEYFEEITISNKRLDFENGTFNIILPEDKKYLMTTNASKFQVGKVNIIIELFILFLIIILLFIIYIIIKYNIV